MKLAITGSGTTCTVKVAGVPPFTEVAVIVTGVCVVLYGGPEGAVKTAPLKMPADADQLTPVFTDPVTVAL
jgi:hypothetical protein